MRPSNPVYRAMIGVLDMHRIPHRVEHRGGKHPALVFSHEGESHNVIFADSPSDWRAPKQARAYIRRLLRRSDEKKKLTI
jgi:hypothetical protein